MSTLTEGRPRVSAPPQAPLWALARIEAGRALRHPAPWIGILLWATSNVMTLRSPQEWSSAHYEAVTHSMTFLALGASVATAYAFSRERADLCEEAPMPADRRAAARLLGCLTLTGLVAIAVAAGALSLRLAGGVSLGVEPGRTPHANFTLAELLQPLALTAFAVALAAAVVHVVKHPLAASILLSVMWFIAGPAYWAFNGPVLRWFAPVLVQPLSLNVAPPETDPLTLPAGWLLDSPGEFQDHWARIVVVPELAAWHALYLLGLTLLAAAVAIPGYRRRLAALGAVLAIVAVLLQASVTP